MRTMSIPEVPTPQKRVYGALRGIDLVSNPAQMSLSRSPDCLNVWKDYSDTAGRAIETRKGFKTKGTVASTIHGIHRFLDAAFIHYGTKLITWGTGTLDTLPEVEDVRENTLSEP